MGKKKKKRKVLCLKMQNHAGVMKHLGTENIQESKIIVQIISYRFVQIVESM